MNNDEIATMELIDNEKRVALGKIQKIVKEWTNNLDEINQSIKITQKIIDQEESKLQSSEGQEESQIQSRDAQEASQSSGSQATVRPFLDVFHMFSCFPLNSSKLLCSKPAIEIQYIAFKCIKCHAAQYQSY